MEGDALEALKLISDWAKWLVTIETGAIAVIGAMDRKGGLHMRAVRAFATLSVVSFVISIAGAAFLFLSLPEIAQRGPGTNIWLTEDSFIGGVLGANLQDLAIIESAFFGLGVLAFAAMVIARVWGMRDS